MSLPEYGRADEQLEMELCVAEIKKLQGRANDLYLAARSYQELAACYGNGKQPTEKLIASIQKAQKVMETKQ